MPRRPPPTDPRAMLDELMAEMSGRSFPDMAAAQRFLDAHMRAYNTRPQRELGGLTPLDMSELLAGDWVTSGVLRVNAALAPDEIGDPDLLFNARAILATLRDEGPAKVTEAGNLSREFVKRVLPRLRWPPGWLEETERMSKVINESDVRPLEILRHVLAFAGLIHRRKGFRLSPGGRALLDEARRGELFALLFRTYFRQLDLRAVDGWDGDAGLQHTIAFTFWKLRTAAASWVTPARLVDIAWLETAKEPLPPTSVFHDDRFRQWRFRQRVIEPLVGFGLLESRDLPAKEPWERPIEVRKTSLYDRALLFRFGQPIG